MSLRKNRNPKETVNSNENINSNENTSSTANTSSGRSFFKTLKPLGNLWPAAVVAGVVALSLPMTAPVLEEVPERLAELAEEIAGNETVKADETDTLAQAVGNYEDGVYTGSAQGYGGPVKVQVTVENHQITSVEILSSSGETEKFFKRAQKVIDSVLLQQTWEVDSVSGATYSSKGILGAIQNAITGETVVNQTAKKTTPKKTASVSFTDPDSYKDGTYYGSAQGFGGTIKVCVTVSGGKITSVTLVSASGETSAYLNKAKSILKTIVSKQSPNVDTVSGATYSSKGIINAAKKALSQASVSGSSDTEEIEDTDTTDNSEIIDPTGIVIPAGKQLTGDYTDGTYEGTAEGFGGDVTMRITISGNQIINIQTVSAEDETPMFFNKATGVITEMLENQTTDVDTVSGATYSSGGIINAVKNALQQAEAAGSDDQDETGETGDTDNTGDADNTGNTGNTEGSDDTGDTDSTDPDAPAEKLLDGNYTDGNFEGSGEGFGGDIIMQVTLSGNRITDIQTVSAEDETPKFFNKALGVVAEILENQTTEVDAVSGATYSSGGIIDAVKDALSKAVIEESDEETGEDETGEGTGSEDTGSEGTGSEGSGSDGTGSEGTDSDGTGAGSEGAGSEGTGSDGTDSDGIGAGSEGAGSEGTGSEDTGSGDESGNTGDKTGDEEDTGLYVNGEYTKTVTVVPDEDEDFDAYSITLCMTVSGGKITALEYPSSNTFDGNKTNTRLSKKALEGIAPSLLAKQSAVGIDTVTNATCSSNAILSAARTLISEAAKSASK